MAALAFVCGLVLTATISSGCAGGGTLQQTCDSNEECGTGFFCSNGTCVESGCATSEECPGELICREGLCRRPRERCAALDECDEGFVCDLPTGRCLSRVECAVTGCDDGEICVEDQGLCVPDDDCRAVPCGADEVCNLASGACEPAVGWICNEDNDCPDNQVCDGGVCRRGCRSDAGCRDGFFCDAVARTCVCGSQRCDGCGADGDCPASRHCDRSSGVCLAGCSHNDGCAAGEICDSAANECFAFCRTDDACEPGWSCNLESRRCERDPATCGGRTCPSGAWCDPFDGSCRTTSEAFGACAVDGDCLGDALCRAILTDQGAVALRCDDAVGGGLAGEPCEGDGDCATGLCLDGACWSPCAVDTDCAAGELCRRVSVTPQDDPFGRAFDIPACVVPPPGCESQADCEEGFNCAIDANESGELRGICVPDQGEAPLGTPCLSGEQCESGTCQGFVCRGICGDDTECGGIGRVCVEQDVLVSDGGTPDPSDDLRGAASICIRGEGSRAVCQNPRECRDGEACVPIPEGGGVGLRCVPPIGTRGGGEPCESDGECLTGVCLADGICHGACSGDVDCAGGTACGFQTVQVGGVSGNVAGCFIPPEACRTDRDCEAGDVCYPIEDPTRPDRLALACVARLAEGTGRAGSPCRSNGECATGLCLSDGICFGTCVASGDCNAGSRCYVNQIAFTFDKGDSDPTNDTYDSAPACRVNAGSFSPCRADAECPATEYCGLSPNQTRTGWEGRCKIVVGSRPPGQGCSANTQCRSGQCRGGICFGLCRPDTPADCGGGRRCADQAFTVHDRGTPGDTSDDITAAISVCQ